jgi:serine-type D-Ala-D-Ala carboxypeptidase/endopeptidase (penicillin-binding protein 4)
VRVDLVAPPVRYPRTPVLLLILVALLPVAGLTGLLVWSDTKADEYEAFAAADEATTTTTIVGEATAPAPVVTPLRTGLLDYRRAPTALGAVSNANALADQVEQIYGYVGDRSCAAVSVDGRHVTGANETASVIPASNQKLITAAVALEVLGADYRYVTRVTGPPAVGGVIEGDVYLIGGGDPLLTASDFPLDRDAEPAFNVTSLDALADAFVAAGITRINGSLIGDGTRYDDEFFVEGWGDDIKIVEAGPYDALLVNDSRTVGRTAVQPDPNEAAARELVRLLQARGIRVAGTWATGVADPAAAEIASVQSAPLTAVVAEMLTNSDDNTAEMMLKEIGFATAGQGTRAAGLNAVDQRLRTWGVPMDGVRPIDGSGLSIEDRVTCAAMLAVLQHAAGGPVAAGLPVAGRTGTLVGEFVGTSVEGRLMAKTGTLGNPPENEDPPAVKALAGYLPATNGDSVEFVLILNEPDLAAEKYQPLWGALAERLDSYPAGADPAALGPR